LLDQTFHNALSQQITADPFLLHAEKSVSYEGFDVPESEIHAESAPDLKCSRLVEAIDCNPKESCDLNKSCDPGWACPDCSVRWDFWNSVVDCGARVGCEADKGRFKAQQCTADEFLGP
jgi:hypothetical protein